MRRMVFATAVALLFGCTSPKSKHASKDADITRVGDPRIAAVSSSQITDVRLGLYAYKVHITWHRDVLADIPTIDEWISVRAENYTQAQFKALDYSMYIHNYCHRDGGLWSLGEAIQAEEH